MINFSGNATCFVIKSHPKTGSEATGESDYGPETPAVQDDFVLKSFEGPGSDNVLLVFLPRIA
jgi:hypothetical protein